jgi:enamine deaminase RidA (YjgF/YER057c/UK114 family)
MKKTYLNPPGSPTPKSYHHVVTTEPGKMIFLSGQVAFDNNREIVGEGDVVEQTRQAMRNLKSAVETGAVKSQISSRLQLMW